MREPRSLSDVRRKDRQVEDEAFIRALLNRAPMGVMATVRDGQPFVNSNTFVFDEPAHAIYMHSARTGRTACNAESAEAVCFTVTEMGRLLPSERAFNMSVEYSSVVAFGRTRLVTDDASKRYALDLLVRKYFPHLAPGVDYRLPDDDELNLTAVYRITIDEWSGKQKKAEDAFPDAFRYGEHGAVPGSGNARRAAMNA
jgi:nitroimidazol reductase NimA-like FMN-containing flavoprotein (pyridoxamine 5'-phosphate oxidase superfamily)